MYLALEVLTVMLAEGDRPRAEIVGVARSRCPFPPDQT